MTLFREMPKENQRKSRTLQIKQFPHTAQHNSAEESKIKDDYVETLYDVLCAWWRGCGGS